jgi:hypothetical protein
MKTIQEMKNELRINLLITDEDKRAETLMRLTLLCDLSGAFAGTSEHLPVSWMSCAGILDPGR